MKTYKCAFIDRPGEEKVHASSHREAYEKFLKAHGVQDFPVIVWSGFTDSGEIFRDHLKTIEEKNAEWEQGRMKKALAVKKTHELAAQEKFLALEQALSSKTKCRSYLELHPDTRATMSSYINKLIEAFEKRGLEPAEIKFIETWLNVKDRGLGESLIARRIASLPAAERSSSRFGNMMLLGMMANTMRLENALDDVQDKIASVGDEVAEIQEDVGDMHEGFGFEE